MKIIALATAAAALALGGAQETAARQGDRAQDEQGRQLSKALTAMVAERQPPGQSNRPDDPDMGDDNAARRAIFVVCTRNGPPSSERSAICDRSPVSPN